MLSPLFLTIGGALLAMRGHTLTAALLTTAGYLATVFHMAHDHKLTLATLAFLCELTAIGGAGYMWYKEVYPELDDGKRWLEITASIVPILAIVGIALACVKCVQFIGIVEGGVYLLIAGFFVGSSYVGSDVSTHASWILTGALGVAAVTQALFIVCGMRRNSTPND